jgi:hypothetical protein
MFTAWTDLRQHLKAYVRDAVTLLEQSRELPRPQFTALELGGNLFLLDQLHRTSSCGRLETFLRESGLEECLRSVGHTWYWHREVFPDLFVELLVSRARGRIPAAKDFDRLFAAAQRDLSRSRSHLRLLVVVHGLPASRQGVRVDAAARLVPVDMRNSPYELYRHLALNWQRGDTERDAFNGHLLVVDEFVERGGDGTQAIRAYERMQRTAHQVVLAARLGLGHVVIGDTYLCHVSAFPLFPLIHWPNPDLGGGRVETLREWTPGQSQRLRGLLRVIQSSGQRGSGPPQTALRRFNQAFRFSENTSNIIDLIVCLESMMDVQQEELRRRLSQRVALLLSNTESKRRSIYELVSTAYNIRNALAHGRGDPEKTIRATLRGYYSGYEKTHAAESLERDLARLTGELRAVTRLCILAFMECQFGHGKWPREEDWDMALFSRKALRELQAKLRTPSWWGVLRDRLRSLPVRAGGAE